MKSIMFLPSLLLCGVLLYLPVPGVSEGNTVVPVPASLPESQNQLILLGESGITPPVVRMKKEDSIALFYNDTVESLVNLQIEFGKNATHCASSNLVIGEDGVIRSKSPVGPKDFASTCFHDAGTYSYVVFGLRGNPEGIKGSIIVE